MRGLTEDALCLRLAGRLEVLAVVAGECSGDPSLGSRTAASGSGGGRHPQRLVCGPGARGPGGRGRKEKDGHATASPQASGGGRAFSSGNPNLDSPRRRRPFAALAGASGKWASSGVPLWAPRPGRGGGCGVALA